MARSMAADDTELFRAVVTITYTDTAPEGTYPDRSGTPVPPRVMTEILGPYRTKGAATQAIKRADASANWYKRYYDDVTTEGYVERAQVVWERLP